MRSPARLLCVAILSACASAGSGGGGAAGRTGGPVAPREERVLITAFDVIPAVAVTQRTVYVATPDAIGALDRDFDRWIIPVTRADGYPGGTVSAIAADPVEDGVWVGVAGSLVYWRPMLDQLVSAPVPGGVDAIIFDRRNPGAGPYVRGAGGWSIATRTGFVTPTDPMSVPPPDARIAPSTLRDVYRAYPALQSTAALLTRDAQLRSWQVISGARAPDRSEVWLGTRGGGLFRVDPVFLRGTQLPFGPLETGTGALARVADEVWMAGLGRSFAERSGITAASTDLQHWRWVSGSLARPLAGARANRLDIIGSEGWIATDRGVAMFDTRDASRFLLWTMTNGLPSDQALAVAPAAGGVWVGTSRGLTFIAAAGIARAARASDVSRAAGADVAIRALLAAGDTLWIGSDQGLLLLRGASPDSLPRRVAISDPRLSRPIRALARSDSVVAVATATDLVVIDPRRAAVLRGYDAANIALVRGVNALAMDERTIWVAGEGGVLVIARSSGASRFLAAPGVVPASALDVALDPSYAWVATRAGVLRLRRTSDGGIR